MQATEVAGVRRDERGVAMCKAGTGSTPPLMTKVAMVSQPELARDDASPTRNVLRRDT